MMTKRMMIWMILFLLIPAVSFAVPPISHKIGGKVTVDGIELTQATDSGYTFRVTRLNGSDYLDMSGDPAQDIDGLNDSGYYLIGIPMYESTDQPQGAKPGDAAVIHAYLNGVELPIVVPVDGRITIGESGDTHEIHVQIETGPPNQAPTADAGPDQNKAEPEQGRRQFRHTRRQQIFRPG